ncbi:aldose epimerase family protein [Formosa sp. 3Alg 14/1]|uniref:aldose epimerase family protein n=1 Tax=Formosa sp. 3Alg 14/1 TaxID=3382190 RepID=UPI0039BDBE7C
MGKVSINQSVYGTTPEGDQVDLYTLKNAHGMQVDVITFGGIITKLTVSNTDGKFENVVLGYDNLESYLSNPTYFGAIIGRFGNRISKGKFSLNGTDYPLAINNGPNHLHGGIKGFDKVIWNAEPIETNDKVALKLSYLSEDMEEGYPGNLNVTVTYTLRADNTLEVAYQATTDKATVVNLTQHSYFNLSGDFTKTVTDEEVMINADFYVPTDETAIPLGTLESVTNTPFDFRTPKRVGQDINAEHSQIANGSGYDHTWVLNHPAKQVNLVASVLDKDSGRYMEVFTDQPGVQFYTGNFLDSALPYGDGAHYADRTGLCLETQHYPDSPNQEDFPSTVLNPGDIYKTETHFKFSVK